MKSIKENFNNMEIYLTKTQRLVLYAVSALIFIASAINLFINLRPHEVTKEDVLNSYNINTEAAYKVHLSANDVFEEEYLEEGRLYPSAITDSVSIEFKSALELVSPVQLSGDYSIKAVLQGYQEGNSDNKIIIYEKTYPIKEGKIEEELTDSARINESLDIERSVYKDYAQAIENAIGGESPKDFYILFSGRYDLEGEEKEFSYKVNIPINNDRFYEVTKDETVVDAGDITETNTEIQKPELGSYVIYIILIIAALGVAAFVRFFTKNMEGERLRIKKLAGLMRRYGNRMVCVMNIPHNVEKTVINVKSIMDLIGLSDELGDPIFYTTDENELPKEGKFYILAMEYEYILDVYAED